MKLIGNTLAKRLFAGLMLAALVFMAAGTAQAAGPLYRTTYPSKITNKLWRGVGNVVFCWVEIPLEINEEVQNTDPFTGSVVGFWTGMWYTVRRFGVGLVDVVTFPVDIYGNNYQSVQRTEFPFIDEVE